MKRTFTKYPSNIMASVDLPFSKKAKQYAQAAWNKGMSVDKAYNFVFNTMTKDGYSTEHECVPAVIQKAVKQVYEEEGDPNDPSTWVGACDKVVASEVSSDMCKELAVDIFLKYKKGMNFIDIAQELGLSLNDTKKLYNSIGAGCNIRFIVYPNDTTNGAIGRNGQIYTPGEEI